LLLAFVQFSSSAEAVHGDLPRRSLKTEQRAKRRREHEARATLRSDPVDVQEDPIVLAGEGCSSRPPDPKVIRAGPPKGKAGQEISLERR
jgi:hypothetical protein